jgi:hypothetical protein
MGYFSEFFDRERQQFSQQINADPSQANARNRIGDVIGRAAQGVPAGPSAKKAFGFICTSLIHMAESIGAVQSVLVGPPPMEAKRLGFPPLMWVRALLALLMLLIGTFWAGTFSMPVTCVQELAAPIPPGQSSELAPAPPIRSVACQQIVQVSQSHTVSTAMVALGMILLLLELAAAFTRYFSRVPILRSLAPPQWLDPYTREQLVGRTGEVTVKLKVSADALEVILARAFEQLDKARDNVHEPAIERAPVPTNILAFIQRAWVHRDRDQERLRREMGNVKGLLEANGLQLVEYTKTDQEHFDLVEEVELAAPETTLPAIVAVKSGRALLRGQAFVPRQ